MLKRWFLLMSLLALSLNMMGQIIINELMQSNIDCMMDDINEFPDSWVELYNNGESVVSLSGYSIGITPEPGEAWALPVYQVPAHNYVVIFCDKEADKLHTDFKLESGKGGAVYLFKNGNLVDQVSGMSKQPAPNIAYGRKTDASDVWGYQEIPTPKAANCGSICDNILGEPLFSEKGRVFSSNQTIKVELSLPEGSPEGTIIRYTLDGSEPKESSLIYREPFVLASTRLIRAKLFHQGWLSPRSTTQSFIFHNREVTLPVISIVTDNKYFFDNKLGIYVEGNYKSGKKNYEYNWRRPISFEYFEEADVESSINQLCETRVQGGASRGCQLKSLIVYANKRFGQKRLDYEFFPDQRPGQNNFKSVILRNAGNDFDYLYMRDAIIQRTMAANTDLDWQAWRPAIIYLNGTYKGMLNIRERSTADNIYTNYNELEDIDMLENWSQVKEGDNMNWKQFEAFYAEHGHTLEEYAQWIDWKEFINLMIMNLFYNNQDFPGNNIVMWRPRAEGGKWRFVAKDTDFGLGLYGSSASYNSIEWIYNPNYDGSRNWANQYQHTRLFRRMMEDDDFKREFIDRAAIYMGDFMNAGGTREYWDPMYELISTEYPHHRRLINQWWPNYNSELITARSWLEARPSYFYQHLANYYQLGSPIPVQININSDENDLAAVDFTINGVKLTKGVFNGKFFKGRDMNIEATPVGGRQVTGWKLTFVGSGTNTQDIDGPVLNFTVPACQMVLAQATFDDIDGIQDANKQLCRWSKNGNQLTLHGIDNGESVTVYDLHGMIIHHFTSSGGDAHLTLPGRSVYVVKVGSHTFKVK